MEIHLRNNQVEPIRKAICFFNSNNPPSILVAPTAFGKSLLIGQVAAAHDKMIVVSPSVELLRQNYAKFISFGGLGSIYSASAGEKIISNTVFVTIGSVKKMSGVFRELGFKKLICDEADRFPRESDGMLNKFIREAGIVNVLGVTATPLKLQTNMGMDRVPFSKLQMLTSRSKKGQFYKDIIHVSQIEEMVRLGYWSKLEYEQYDFDGSMLRFNSTKSDYTDQSVKDVYKSNNTHSKIIERIKDMPERKSILVFVPSVQEAIDLSAQIPNSAAVYGEMDKTSRSNAVERFKAGRIRVAINVNVLSVGFDHVEIDAILMARSTASIALYYQQVGRGTRISPNKKDCLIVDFSGNVKKFGRVENLTYKKNGNYWQLYGENNRLLTGVPMHEMGFTGVEMMPFGKFKGQPIKNIPSDYAAWLIDNVSWNPNNEWLKNALNNKLCLH